VRRSGRDAGARARGGRCAGCRAAAPSPERGTTHAREDRRSEDRAEAREDRPDPRDLPTPELDGRPLWTATSRLTSEENAARAFEAHGEDFAAGDVNAYVKTAHGFLKSPPEDVLTLTRANGDKLYYAPGDNVFAVAREDGAPRTLFKPDEGMAYWREQEQRESERADSGGSRRDRDQRG
jgi:pyocin large subunit-like protein